MRRNRVPLHSLDHGLLKEYVPRAMIVSLRTVQDGLRRQIRWCLFWIAVCTVLFYLDSSTKNFDAFLFCLFLAIPLRPVYQIRVGLVEASAYRLYRRRLGRVRCTG